jgi:predicted nucleic acid-binding protein
VILYYLDASAWVKRYYQEKGTKWVQELFSRNEPVASATLGVIEVAATLSRKRKAQEITLLQLKQKIEELDDDWVHFVQIQMTRELTISAKEIAHKHALRGADAIHLASAMRLEKRVAGHKGRMIMVASDAELIKAAKEVGLDVLDPETQDAIAL